VYMGSIIKVISGTAGAGGVIALKFFGIASDSPTA